MKLPEMNESKINSTASSSVSPLSHSTSVNESRSRVVSSPPPATGVDSHHQFTSLRPFDPISSLLFSGTSASAVADSAAVAQPNPNQIDRAHSVTDDISAFNPTRYSRKKLLKKKNKSKRNSFLNSIPLPTTGANPANDIQMQTPTSLVSATGNSAIMPTEFNMNSVIATPNEFYTSPREQGLTKRNVIIQKDSKGYGIRISGDNPVYIQHVNPDGAAYKAGVRSCDRIIKVNGTLVTRLGHAEVVKMIQSCGSFVGLTLLSGPPDSTFSDNSPTHSPTPPVNSSSTNHPLHHLPHHQPSFINSTTNQLAVAAGVKITGPQPVPVSTYQAYQDNQIETLKKMIDNQYHYLAEMKNDPNTNELEIEKTTKVIEDLKRKLDDFKHQQLQAAGSISYANTLNNNSNKNNNAYGIVSHNEMNTGNSPNRIMPMDSDYEEDDSATSAPFTGAIAGELNDNIYIMPFDEDGLNNNSNPTNNISVSNVPVTPTPAISTLYSVNSKYFPKSLSNAKSGSKRDSKIITLPPVSIDSVHIHSLRIARYLIQNQVAPHALLFYTVTKHIFPTIASNMLSSGTPAVAKQIIQRWAYQIVATWAVKDSPLFFKEYPQECLDLFDKLMDSFLASTSPIVGSLFDPFMDRAKEIVIKQLNEFQIAAQMKPEWLATSPSLDLQAAIEMSFVSPTSPSVSPSIGKVDIRDIDAALDQFISHANVNSVSTIAIVSSMLTISNYLFGINSKHILLSDLNTALSGSGVSIVSGQHGTSSTLSSVSALNPVLKLSSDSSASKSKYNHKRNVSMTSNSRNSIIGLPTGKDGSDLLGQSEAGHYFIPITEMSRILFCSGCMFPIWGEYSYKCIKCLMKSHLWCRKQAAANNPCEQSHGTIGPDAFTSVGPSARKNRRNKSDKKSVFEKITGTFQKQSDNNFNSKSICSLSSTSESSSSSSDSTEEEDFAADDAEHQKLVTSHIQSNKNFNDNRSSTITITPSMVQQAQAAVNSNKILGSQSAGPVNRSGSFNQRKKSKSSAGGINPRKRSDPALTSRNISTINSNTGIESKQLTSARSSGALLNYPSASSNTGQDNFRPIGERGQRSKNLTASDSLLITNSMSVASNASTINNRSSTFNKSLSTNSSSLSTPRQTRHKKTSDSGIQMETECSSESEDEKASTNDLVESTKTDQTHTSTDDTAKLPPPLPPRPMSEKRRQIQAEIVESEERHYEVLTYIRSVYQRPLKKEKFFTKEQIESIFANIKMLRKVHKHIYKMLNAAHLKDVNSENVESCYLEQALKDLFCGPLGKMLETEASTFCVNQKIGYGIEIWNQRKKDSRLKGLLDTEMRSKEMPGCKLARLGLQDLLGTVFQRPLRYPLLLDRLLHATPNGSQAHTCLEQALICSRDLVKNVDDATRQAEFKTRLAEIIRKTDCSSFQSPAILEQLEHHELIHEGPLVWRITKQKLVDVLLILTNQILLVLTRDSNDRYCLKQHTNPSTKRPHKPDIRMDDLLTRDVATDPTAFFLVSKNQDIIYEFAAQSQLSCKQWKDAISKTICDYRDSQSIPTNRLQDLSNRSIDLSDNTVNNNTSNANRESEQPVTTSTITSNNSNIPIPPPIPPPVPPSVINRPLPEPPTDEDESNQAPHQPRYAGYIQNVLPQESDLVQFNQVKIIPEPKVLCATHQSTPQDLKEIDDNIRNLIHERRKTQSGNFSEDLELGMNDLFVVCDIAQHDPNSRTIKHQLISDLFNKAIKMASTVVDEDVQKDGLLKQNFNKLIKDVDVFLKMLSDPNPSKIATTENGDQSGRNSKDLSTEILHNSQESLQEYLEDFADKQINEFESNIEATNNQNVANQTNEAQQLSNETTDHLHLQNQNNLTKLSLNPFLSTDDISDSFLNLNYNPNVMSDTNVSGSTNLSLSMITTLDHSEIKSDQTISSVLIEADSGGRSSSSRDRLIEETTASLNVVQQVISSEQYHCDAGEQQLALELKPSADIRHSTLPTRPPPPPPPPPPPSYFSSHFHHPTSKESSQDQLMQDNSTVATSLADDIVSTNISVTTTSSSSTTNMYMI